MLERSSNDPATLDPAVAGSWYPAGREALATLVDELLAAARSEPSPLASPARAVVVPHAGYAFSGPVAARGFRALPREAKRVLLIGPSHYADFVGACVPPAERYRTPLGDVPLDAEALEAIATCPGLRRDLGPFEREHSLEAEIPFLQRQLESGFRLVPVLLGGASPPGALDEVAAALRPLCEPGTLLVASSDFTHYGPRFGYVPFRERVEERIRELDLGAIEVARRKDRVGFRRYLDASRATVCGRAAIDVLLGLLAPQEPPGVLVAYDTSGRIVGDWEHSVSYASLVFA